jgi:V/A-type H+/Na+-transporting ATPase subunit D
VQLHLERLEGIHDMAKLNIAPTKSNLLALKRQLDLAEEGYDLLEQKRQILILELMHRLNRAETTEKRVTEALSHGFTALREAELDIGSKALDAAALGVVVEHEVKITSQHLMGLRIPRVRADVASAGVQFGLGGTSANTDVAMNRFVELLPMLAELAELENAVLRLARELRKTQRRCNALSKILIPDYQQAISYITEVLEEREREAFVILKMIRNRLAEEHSSSIHIESSSTNQGS